MEFWFSEFHTPDVKHSIRVNKQLYSKQSDYQRIDIFETPEFGRVLTLDGNVMLTERDEFIYDEMIVHVPMAVHKEAKDILVIGAGDGGVVRELTRYDRVERIDLVEMDPQVVEACRSAMQRSHKRIASTFPISRVYQAHIPTFAAGYWLFGFASKKYHPIDDLDAESWKALNMRTRYYTTKLHIGAFYLPAFLEEMLREVEEH